MVGGEQEHPKIDFIFVGKIYNKKNPRNTRINRCNKKGSKGTHGTQRQTG